MQARFAHILVAAAHILVPLCGCLSERSHPMNSARLVRLAADDSLTGASTVRAWLEQAEAQLRPLLPALQKTPLTTAGLSTAVGRARDVYAYFDRDPRFLHTLFCNLDGLQQTAQCVGADTTGTEPMPAWPDFEDVWVPVREDLQLFGRLGLARQGGSIANTTCVVVLPGLFGSLSVMRTRDVCEGLRQAGYHALAIELRGTGRTGIRYPQWPCNFGTTETGDLLAVSEWLENRPNVRNTGLIGFCWGANEALLTAYEDGRPADHPSITPQLQKFMPPRTGRPHFTAGVLAFSPVLAFEELMDKFERSYDTVANPVLAGLEETIRFRASNQGFTGVGGNFRRLIRAEVNRTPGAYPTYMEDGLRYLRLMRYETLPDYDKLECARVPTLIVHAANDPLSPADRVAQQMARVQNPNVAALMLPGGGHDGFSAYARDYTFSLIVSFFDGHAGAAAVLRPRTAAVLTHSTSNHR